jgi:uncharacterized RDD family membrane protein YckC
VSRRNPLEGLPQTVAEAVVTRIVQMIDVNEIVQRVDVDAVIQRVDVNAIVDKVEVDRVLDAIDVNALMARVDINAIAGRIDMDQLMQNTEFSTLIAKSTSGALSEFLDLLRRQIVAVDVFVDRLFRRGRFSQLAPGPPALSEQWTDQSSGREGVYAGAVSRLVAIVVDVFVAWAVFLLVIGAIQATLSLFWSHPPTLFHHGLVTGLVALGWIGLYFSFQWSLGGRTLGMAFAGVRVVADSGERIGRPEALTRILVLPVSILALGLGLLGLELRADRRGWHDLAARTSVVYDWDARAARLRWLSK